MKKTLLILIFAIIGIASYAQSIWKPVPADLFKTYNKSLTVGQVQKTVEWIPRISAGLIAVQWTLEDGIIQQSAFNKVGLGFSYARFIDNEGTPYNDLSVNGFVFFPTDGSSSALTIAATVSALKYIQVGLDYDFGLKKVGLLTGIAYTF